MAGTPRKRARETLAVQKRVEVFGRLEADEGTHKLGRPTDFNEALADDIVALVAAGVPIQDCVLNGAVIAPGVARRVGINPATIFEWQAKRPHFAEAIARAREEAADAIADRMLALADLALREPAYAHAVRVAADIMRWQAAVRHPQAYSERRRAEGYESGAITVQMVEFPNIGEHGPNST